MQNTKFLNPEITAKGEPRAWVELKQLKTLWFNTGTLCNLACQNCYIESSPTNDRLVYLEPADFKIFLDEFAQQKPPDLIGLTGGEPFLNPSIIPILELILSSGFEVLVLTNAYRVIKKHKVNLLSLKDIYGSKLKIRVSLDHYTAAIHEKERGAGTFGKTLEQLKWFYDNNFEISIAGRSLQNETRDIAIKGFSNVLKENGINLEVESKLVVFPEMKTQRDVPEITTACWDLLNSSPDNQMCATERMIVKRKGDTAAVVMPCTLLAYDKQFVLGKTLNDARKKVHLNHRFCAEFCVLGNASCSAVK